MVEEPSPKDIDYGPPASKVEEHPLSELMELFQMAADWVESAKRPELER